MTKAFAFDSPSDCSADESPAISYDRQRKNYRSCVEECKSIFKKLQTKDEEIKLQQNNLYLLLVDADTAYEKMDKSKDNTEKRKKCCSNMKQILTSLKKNLSEQDTALRSVKKDIENATIKLKEFSTLINDTYREHNDLTVALDQKIEELNKDFNLSDEKRSPKNQKTIKRHH